MSGLGGAQKLVSAWLDWVGPKKLVSACMASLGGSEKLVSAWQKGGVLNSAGENCTKITTLSWNVFKTSLEWLIIVSSKLECLKI
jgi:membrane protein required for beta-lactamase induction